LGGGGCFLQPKVSVGAQPELPGPRDGGGGGGGGGGGL